MEFTDDMTLGEARALMSEAIFDGQVCPCCTRMAKVYKRTIYKGMIESLVGLYQNNGTDEFVHWSVYSPGHGDFAKLRYWDLIEESDQIRKDGGKAGYWKITDEGKSFLRGKTKIPKHALIYDGDLIGLDSTETISIVDAAGEDFDLSVLMSEVI